MQARKAGWHFQPIPKVNFEDGIEAIRFVFPKLRIHKENCKLFLQAIREYARSYDDVKARFTPYPVDNWTTHPVDALRYLALTYRRLFEVPQSQRSYTYGD